MDRAGRSDGKSVFNSDPMPPIVAAATCGIAVMAKASAPGRAKTRLVPPLTYDEAAELNTAFLCDVADNMLAAARRAAPGAGISGYAAYGPSGTADFFRRTMPAVGLIDAGLSNFGDCLFRTIEEILARGHASAVVLNSDSPNLPTALLNMAASILAQPGDRAVLGPSSDGGYYLLGLKTAHRRMFKDVAWSTEHVAGQTLERARDINLAIDVLPVWYDVDDVGSLRKLRATLRQPSSRIEAQCPHFARHTAALLDRLGRDGDFTRRVEGFTQTESVSA